MPPTLCECFGRLKTGLLQLDLCRTATDIFRPFTVHLQCRRLIFSVARNAHITPGSFTLALDARKGEIQALNNRFQGVTRECSGLHSKYHSWAFQPSKLRGAPPCNLRQYQYINFDNCWQASRTKTNIKNYMGVSICCSRTNRVEPFAGRNKSYKMFCNI